MEDTKGIHSRGPAPKPFAAPRGTRPLLSSNSVIGQQLKKSATKGQIGRATTLIGSALIPIGVGMVMATGNPVFLLVSVSGLALAGAGAMFASVMGEDVSKENLMRLAVVGLIAGAAAAAVIVIGPSAAFAQIQEYLPAIVSAAALIPVVVSPDTIRTAKRKVQAIALTIIESGFGLFRAKFNWEEQARSLNPDTFKGDMNELPQKVDELYQILLEQKARLVEESQESKEQSEKLKRINGAMGILKKHHPPFARFLVLWDKYVPDENPKTTKKIYERLQTKKEDYKGYQLYSRLLDLLSRDEHIIKLQELAEKIGSEFSNAVSEDNPIPDSDLRSWISALEEECLKTRDNAKLISEIKAFLAAKNKGDAEV